MILPFHAVNIIVGLLFSAVVTALGLAIMTARTKHQESGSFFEKKNQKTFDYKALCLPQRGHQCAKVFASFVKKKLFFLCSTHNGLHIFELPEGVRSRT